MSIPFTDPFSLFSGTMADGNLTLPSNLNLPSMPAPLPNLADLTSLPTTMTTNPTPVADALNTTSDASVNNGAPATGVGETPPNKDTTANSST